MERVKMANVLQRLAVLERTTGRKFGVSNSDKLYMLDVCDDNGHTVSQPYAVRGVGLREFYDMLGAALEGARIAKDT